MDRKELIKIALECERYEKKLNGTESTIGGLHDYIHRMKDACLRGYIINVFERHPDLRFSEIKAMADSREELDPLMLIETIDPVFTLGEEVEEHLKNLSRDDLIKLAFACERYHNKMLNADRPRMGGLHDYVWRLEDEAIRKIIRKEILEHPEINNKEKLKEMISDHNTEIEVVAMLDTETEPIENTNLNFLQEPEENRPIHNKARTYRIKRAIKKKLIKKKQTEKVYLP